MFHCKPEQPGPCRRSIWSARSRDRIPVEARFRTLLDWPCCPTNFLPNGHRVLFLGVKRLGRGVYHSLPSSAEVEE